MNLRRSLQRQRKSAGFSIVEVMIVLAISGVLFISVVVMVSGRRASTEFNQAITSVKSELEQTINEVESGYYGDPASAVCLNNGSGWPMDRSNCVFIGKLVQFQTTNDNEYAVHTLVGRRSATTFATAGAYSAQNLMDKKQLFHGLRPVFVRAQGIGNLQAFGIVTQFAADASTGIVSGTRSVMIVPKAGSSADSFTALQSAVMPASFYTAVNPPTGVEICFRSGTTDQSGLITIGGQNAAQAVELTIKGTVDCS